MQQKKLKRPKSRLETLKPSKNFMSSDRTAHVLPAEMTTDVNTLQNETEPNNSDVVKVPKVPTDISLPEGSLISFPLEVSISSKTDILSANNIAGDLSSDKPEVPPEVTRPDDLVDPFSIDLSTNSASVQMDILCEENKKDVLESMELVSALATSVSHTNTQRDFLGHSSIQSTKQYTNRASLNACSPSDCDSHQTVSSEERKQLSKIAKRRRAKVREDMMGNNVMDLLHTIFL